MTKILYFQKREINKIPKIKIVKIKKRGISKIEFKKIPPIKERQKYKRILDFVIQNLRKGSGKLGFPRSGKIKTEGF